MISGSCGRSLTVATVPPPVAGPAAHPWRGPSRGSGPGQADSGANGRVDSSDEEPARGARDLGRHPGRRESCSFFRVAGGDVESGGGSCGGAGEDPGRSGGRRRSRSGEPEEGVAKVRSNAVGPHGPAAVHSFEVTARLAGGDARVPASREARGPVTAGICYGLAIWSERWRPRSPVP